MSEPLRKTIQINPELFSVTNSSGKTRKSRSVTQKKRPTIRSNPLKKELLNKIKTHAQKNKKTLKENNDFATTFEEHMDYLNSLVEKRKKLKIHTELPSTLQKANGLEATTSQPPQPTQPTQVTQTPQPTQPPQPPQPPQTPQPPQPTQVTQPPQPPQPTQVTQTPQPPQPTQPTRPPQSPQPPQSQQVSLVPNTITQIPIVAPSPPPPSELYKPREELQIASFTLKKEPPYGNLRIGGKKPTFRKWNKTQKVRPVSKTPVIEKTQEVRKKYSLGRNKEKNKVTVFLKNNKTRRKISDEIGAIQQKPINEIKEYLRKHNLIKVGSEAPNDVLRKLYKESLLAGEINNNNASFLVHNYLSEEPTSI